MRWRPTPAGGALDRRRYGVEGEGIGGVGKIRASSFTAAYIIIYTVALQKMLTNFMNQFRSSIQLDHVDCWHGSLRLRRGGR